MFPYFGSKSQIVHHYPYPRYPTIIEPFAGSARYSLWYHDRQVWLSDCNWVVATIWRWLLAATKDDIMAFPALKPGDDVRRYYPALCPQKLLLGMYTGWSRPTSANKIKSRLRNFKHYRETLVSHLDHVRHWKFTEGDYRELPDLEATWFIDPPYQSQGHAYRHDLDYDELGNWCQSRRGQIIVCEDARATWLPFSPLVVTRNNHHHRNNQEVIWHRLQ